MIRTAWLTSLCLAAFGGSLVTKVVSAPHAEPIEAAKAGTDALRGTLTKADKFAVVFVAQPAEEAQPDPVKPKPGAEIAGSDRSAAMTKRAVVLLPKPRPRIVLARNSDHVKAADSKPCRQHDAIASFLVSAGIAPRCET